MTRRLVLSSVALTVLVLLTLVIPLGRTASRQSKTELTAQLQNDAVAIASFVEDTLEGNADVDLQAVVDNYQTRTGARGVVIDGDGDAVADSEPAGPVDRSFASRPEVAEALGGTVASGTRRSDTLDTRLLFVAVPVASGGEVHGVVRLSYPTSELDERVRNTWLTLIGVATVSLAASAAIGWLLARWVTRPLRRLQTAASALGSGDLQARAPLGGGPPEVRSLAGAFNDTADRLAELVRSQDAFVADASHQMRTPLTALRLRLENLESALPADDRDDAEAALDEVGRLSRLVEGLLVLARPDRTGVPEAAGAVPLVDVVTERTEVWAVVADEKTVDVVVDVPDDLRVIATPDRLSQVLDNLLANALDIVPEGTTIEVRADRRELWVELHVTDEGPGMDAEQRDQAFNRFWQGAAEASGSGLGLSIVQKLVRADGGEVHLDATSSGGLDAVIRLRPGLD